MIYLPCLSIIGELLRHRLVLHVNVLVCVPIQCPRKSAKRTPFSLVAVCMPPPQVALHSECDHAPHSQSTATKIEYYETCKIYSGSHKLSFHNGRLKLLELSTYVYWLIRLINILGEFSL